MTSDVTPPNQQPSAVRRQMSHRRTDRPPSVRVTSHRRIGRRRPQDVLTPDRRAYPARDISPRDRRRAGTVAHRRAPAAPKTDVVARRARCTRSRRARRAPERVATARQRVTCRRAPRRDVTISARDARVARPPVRSDLLDRHLSPRGRDGKEARDSHCNGRAGSRSAGREGGFFFVPNPFSLAVPV